MRHPTPAELHRLFQARMWREYAMAWDGRKTMTGVGREWVEKILRVPRSECLANARAALVEPRPARTTDGKESRTQPTKETP